MKNEILKKFYATNPITNEYIIELGANSYNDIFNSWDSSKQEIRDLNSEMKSYIESCSYDIDLRHNVILGLKVHEQQNEQMEKTIMASIYNYFGYMVLSFNKLIWARCKTAAFFVLVSIMFLIFTILIQEKATESVAYGLAFQSLTIGGWVFLWEAISMILIRGSEVQERRKIYKRLLNAKILFKNI